MENKSLLNKINSIDNISTISRIKILYINFWFIQNHSKKIRFRNSRLRKSFS